MIDPGTILLGKYEVIRPLGRGQFGAVYLVFNRNLSVHSALKVVQVIDPDRHVAVVEAQATSLCGHDHVVKIRTADRFDGAVLIELEYLDGGSLSDRLKSGFVPIGDSISYMKHVLFALDFAHSKGIIHRDVKPANIMISGNIAKLSDFGTAIHPESGARVTDDFYRPHASPEAQNLDEFSARSDVFAAGLTLQRAANNMSDWERLFVDERWRREVADGTLPQKVGYADFLPSRLKTILRLACNKVPDERYPSASAFRQELERLQVERYWVRQPDFNWISERGDRTERITYSGKAQQVEYWVGGRRKQAYCRRFASEREARRFMDRTVADTTLRRSGSRPRI
ncbi:MAG: serine/threonine protein kinase [Mesorhizobium sp.]|uniref:serine/threonine-protein kinase n=1 Tax=Mesorhizobium sp. TaxID=1871066 RepID=UPI0012248FF4|nr:serine/threonine-protein kinase [Mesorhizobium sp.]TIM30127.1 MAG: serine/threonine protein kinase [Mesorhizobium sp.]